MDTTCSTCMPPRIHETTLTRTAISYFRGFLSCAELWADDIIDRCFFLHFASFNFLGNQLRSLLQTSAFLSENPFDFTPPT